MKEGTVKIDLCVVWKYDLFPGFLCGRATEMDRDGKVYVSDYQSTFIPMLLLPPDQYAHLKSQLADLVKIKTNKENEVKKEIQGLMRSSLPNIVVETFKL